MRGTPPIFLFLLLEHIYRRHRRYRITEGAEEIQIRKVAQRLFSDVPPDAPEGIWPRDLPAWPDPQDPRR